MTYCNCLYDAMDYVSNPNCKCKLTYGGCVISTQNYQRSRPDFSHLKKNEQATTKMNDTESKAIWKALAELKFSADQVAGNGKYVDSVIQEFRKYLVKDKELHLKWQRDIEEKCSRVLDDNKRMKVELDALKDMIWKLREKIA